MKIDEALAKLDYKQSGSGYRARCPGHNGEDYNLAIDVGDSGEALFWCHSHQCTYDEIVKGMGAEVKTAVSAEPLKTGELVKRPEKQKAPPPWEREPIATYQYTDIDGNEVFKKYRYGDGLDPKFMIKSGDKWGMGDTEPVLYNLPSVTVADEVWIAEGEKDVDRLVSLGLVATCNFDGASKPKQKQKWLERYNHHFAGKAVYILPDNDEQGDAHASHIYKQLRDVAKVVKVVELPDLPPHGDVSDWLNAGGTVDQLLEMARQADKPAHKWKIKTLQDVPEKINPTKYIVDPILPESSVSIWYGASGSGKSMKIMDLAFSILSGGKFVPGNVPEMICEKRSILWLDMDNGSDVMNERIAAFRRTRNVPNDAPFHYVVMPEPWPFLGDINSQLDLEMAVRDLNAGVVIIDNLGSISGDIDENSAQMVKIMAPLRRLAESSRCAIIVIHHPRKGGANGSRAGDALRGHSVIEAALDYAVYVSKDDTSGITTMSCTKARRYRFDDIYSTFNYTHHLGTNDLETVWYSAPTWRRGTNDVKDAIYSTLENSGQITQTRLIDEVYDTLERKSSKPKIKSWLDQMIEIDGLITVEKGAYNARLLSLK